MNEHTYYGVVPSSSTPVKGRLMLPKQGVNVPVSLVHEGVDYFVGRIANTITNTSFFKNEGWKFEPDRPTLPTKPGFYVPAHILDNGVLPPNYTVYGLTTQGTWTQLRGGNSAVTAASIRSHVEDLHRRGNLVRVNIVRAD